ncbi:major vault protein [Anaeramoeba ignava]|uniref:Major vault protein n=1 Tax=Anaeramoeba ignava TaxID=1746090 RepID=A0A9Q0LJG0_ANAIG|nr:major vault protein [Anaeramoeba ignava]
MSDTIKLKPYEYIHVLDEDTNITRLFVGPLTYLKQHNEKVVDGPKQMILVGPRQYCVIENPVVIEDNEPVLDENGQVLLKYGEKEIRFESNEKFPLYPGEKLLGSVLKLQTVQPQQALRLKAIQDFKEKINDVIVERKAGTEWYFEGPGTYIPNIRVQVLETVKAVFIEESSALKLTALSTFTDGEVTRKAGEIWLETKEGFYLPKVEEKVLGLVKGFVLTDRKALHLKARSTFVDKFGKKRKAGNEWLVTKQETEYYIPGVFEDVVREVPLVILNDMQYCVVLNPVIDGKQHFGKKQLRKGEATLFLASWRIAEQWTGKNEQKELEHDTDMNNENKEKKKKDKKVSKVRRTPGERWMVHGPRRYIPPVAVQLLERRAAIPLHKDEGVYVRDLRTGLIRTVIGETYMLKPYEELWEKELTSVVEKLINIDVDPTITRGGIQPDQMEAPQRDKTRVVTFQIPNNSAVQIYDYKEKTARVQFGPDLVMLEPDEDFTVLSLSAGRPKIGHQVKAIALLLGPDFSTDLVTVETSDHARLNLKLQYAWRFEVNKDIKEESTKIFQVPDFIGDMCKAIGSRIRGSLIRKAVFGVDKKTGHVRDRLEFKANNLIVTDIDIQTVEPIDEETRLSLQKSVQLAISITTQSQEADARHEALKKSTESQGKLEIQQLEDEIEAETTRQTLYQQQADCKSIETAGKAKAQAKAKSEAAVIQGESKVNQATLTTTAEEIEDKIKLDFSKEKNSAEFEHKKQMNLLEIDFAKEMSQIYSKKFKEIVTLIGPETLEIMSQSELLNKAELLEGLNLNGYLIADAKKPVNLIKTANSLLGDKR